MEEVLVVSRELLEPWLEKRAIITKNSDMIFKIIKEKSGFLPREEAEANPAFKQIIPYVSIIQGRRVFASKRLSRGGEARLHNLVSIGFGGHINPSDSHDDPLMDGLRRELREEVLIERPGGLRFLGIINDDTNDVGRVHLGLLFTIDAEGDVAVLETEKLEGFWIEADELQYHSEKMEDWSRMAAGVIMEGFYDMG